MEGKVKFYNVRKGYGFIDGDDGQSYFFHITNLPMGAKVYQDDRVSFESTQGDKGLKADNIQVTGKASEGSTPVEVAASVEEEVAPVEEAAAPVEEEASPVEEEASPVEEVAAPVEEVAAPVEEEVAPVEEVAAPVEEEAKKEENPEPEADQKQE